MSVFHDSDREIYIGSKVAWLRNEDAGLQYNIGIVNAWLKDGIALARGCELTDGALITHLHADMSAYVEECKSLRMLIGSLIEQGDSQISHDAWRDATSRCDATDLELVSLSERCDACDVPIIDQHDA